MSVSADINFGLNVSVGWKKLANVGCRKHPFQYTQYASNGIFKTTFVQLDCIFYYIVFFIMLQCSVFTVSGIELKLSHSSLDV